MKKLVDLELKNWWLFKNAPLTAASCNASYYYEVTRETEKAILIHIISKSWSKLEASRKDWNVWIPKSVIESEY